MTFINELQSLLGRYALVKDADKAPFLTDERGRYHGDAVAVAQPATHEEVMKVMALAARYQIPVVTQGGNTSTVGGSVPLPASNALLLSLKRMRSIFSIDPVSDTIHAQAGVTLTEVHEASESINRFFPLRLASEGTATVGGLLASNAGGTEVLRYGMTRDLVLGYRAVLADGREINELTSLRKNNSGYDLRDLLIGSEGTLAVITEAILKLHPRPLDRKVLFLSLKDLKSVEVVFNAFNAKMHAQMTAFELMGRPTLNKLALMMPEVRQPEVEKTDWHVFIECSYFEANPDTSTLEAVLENLMEKGVVVDGAISETEDDAKDFGEYVKAFRPLTKKPVVTSSMTLRCLAIVWWNLLNPFAQPLKKNTTGWNPPSLATTVTATFTLIWALKHRTILRLFLRSKKTFMRLFTRRSLPWVAPSVPNTASANLSVTP